MRRQAAVGDVAGDLPRLCRLAHEGKCRESGRGDLEDLRAVINHHAKLELHVDLVTIELPRKGKPRA